MRHPLAAGLVVGMIGCGGHAHAGDVDAAPDGTPGDASETNDDAPTSGDDVAVGPVVIGLDAGIFAACIPPDGAPAACAACESFDAYPAPDADCTLQGLQCGVGCTVDCFCDSEARWACSVPPCR
jgi:hypothetical protein